LRLGDSTTLFRDVHPLKLGRPGCG